MTSTNEHTGAVQQSKPSTDAYREGHDRIFGKSLVGAKVTKISDLDVSFSEPKLAWDPEVEEFIPWDDFVTKFEIRTVPRTFTDAELEAAGFVRLPDQKEPT